MRATAGKLYTPIIRTRDAELQGFSQLSDVIKDRLLPVVEYTKSRRSARNRDGAVAKCVERIESALGGRPYVADVTTMSSLSNAETERLLDQDNNFRAWRTFVSTVLGANCVPVVHLTDPLDEDCVRAQCSTFARRASGEMALRVPAGYPHLATVMAIMLDELGSLEGVLLICDNEYVTKHSLMTAQILSMGTLSQGQRFGGRVVAASSFPSSVVLPDYGGDAYGKFDLQEVALSDAVKIVSGLESVLHGDYALIHPADFAGVVTNWVPRVDVPLDRTVYYHRYRRDKGGYEEAAEEAFNDSDYVPLPCWGHDNIASAASGTVLGRSPAHWIGVRVNFHITRQTVRLAPNVRRLL